MALEAIIFDMDGVLVDNRDIHIEAFEIFCRRYGIEPDRHVLLSMFGKGNDEYMPEILPHSLIEEKGIEALGNEKEEVYREIFADRITPAPGLIDFLEEIKTHGLATAVGSSGQKANVDFVLDKCGIRDYFDVLVNGDMVTRCKPDPEIFLTAADRMNIEPTACLVIEDAFAGIEASERAGMKCVALATTYSREQLQNSGATVIVDGFKNLSYRYVRSLFE